jgi:SAM-dependent methyltransferase
VEVVAGDLHEVDQGTLGGPFDLAFSRMFLTHQPNPAETLRRIAGLLRPGGWLVAQEPLRDPAPRSQPPVDALRAYWDLLQQGMERAGVPPGAIEHLPRSARAAGLEIVEANGFFLVHEPEVGFELHASSATAMRERTVRSGVATERQIDELVATLRAAKDGNYEWVSSPFFLDLTLRKPS